MSKKKKRPSGRPGKTANPSKVFPTITPEGLASQTNPRLVGMWWYKYVDAIFSRPMNLDDASAAINALMLNPRTPFQVILDLQRKLQISMSEVGYREFTERLELRWETTPLDRLPPMLTREDWDVEPKDVSRLTDWMEEVISTTRQPACILTAWEFTKEHLVERNPEDLPALISAFENNPASPSEVVADALMLNTLR